MSDLNDYIRTLFLARTEPLPLPAGYHRRGELVPHIEGRIQELLTSFDAASLADAQEVADTLFDEFIANGIVIVDEPRFAGKYYTVANNRYTVYRGKFLEADGIYKTSTRIGERFFPDVFDGYRAQLDGGTKADFKIPASDRIVNLDDNQSDLIKIREGTEELQRSLKTGNDLGDLTAEEAEVAASEVNQLSQILSQPAVRSSTVASFSVKVLKWIAEKAAGAAVGKAAWALLILIATFFGFLS